jgi:hypothetical protein
MRTPSRLLAGGFFIGLLASCATGPDPKSFDHPFPGKTYIHYLSPAEIVSWCGAAARGCAVYYGLGTPDAVCSIYINRAYRNSPKWISCIKKHENRHCNGYAGEANAC